MDHGLVARVGQAGERVSLVVARVGQQRERLIGMAGQDHAIEPLRSGIACRDLHASVVAADAAHRRPQLHAPAQTRAEGVHVALGAALDRVPLRRVAHAQKPVVVEEAHEEAGGHLAHARRRRRPDGSAHRREEVVGQPAPVAASLEELADRDAGRRPDRRARRARCGRTARDPAAGGRTRAARDCAAVRTVRPARARRIRGHSARSAPRTTWSRDAARFRAPA